jgi:hypothetical protein
VQDVVARYFEEEDRFIEAVKRGEAALERGEFLTHELAGGGSPALDAAEKQAVPGLMRLIVAGFLH